MARRQWSSTVVSTDASGIRITLPDSNDLSPAYSRSQVKRIIADLQSALDDEMAATIRIRR